MMDDKNLKNIAIAEASVLANFYNVPKKNNVQNNTQTNKEEITTNAEYYEYIVKSGDSFWKISKNELGTGLKFKALAKYNNMDVLDTIKPGMILKIPYDKIEKPETESTEVKDYYEYTVKSGDSLWKIARDEMGSGGKYIILAEYNGITITNALKVGTVLKIPKNK